MKCIKCGKKFPEKRVGNTRNVACDECMDKAWNDVWKQNSRGQL